MVAHGGSLQSGDRVVAHDSFHQGGFHDAIDQGINDDSRVQDGNDDGCIGGHDADA